MLNYGHILHNLEFHIIFCESSIQQTARRFWEKIINQWNIVYGVLQPTYFIRIRKITNALSTQLSAIVLRTTRTSAWLLQIWKFLNLSFPLLLSEIAWLTWHSLVRYTLRESRMAGILVYIRRQWTKIGDHYYDLALIYHCLDLTSISLILK